MKKYNIQCLLKIVNYNINIDIVLYIYKTINSYNNLENTNILHHNVHLLLFSSITLSLLIVVVFFNITFFIIFLNSSNDI